MEGIHYGTLKFYHKIKGFGVIVADSNKEEIAVSGKRRRGSNRSLKKLKAGDRVSFTLSDGWAGRRRLVEEWEIIENLRDQKR